MADQVDVDTMKMDELKQRLEELSLPVTGTKPVLKERLRAALIKDAENLEQDKDDSEEDGDTDGDDEAENPRIAPRQSRRRRSGPGERVVITFKDVEESLETFTGDNHVNLKHWIEEFEDMAEICNWSDVQKVIYAKRLLGGSAKSFIKHEKRLQTWSKFKRALEKEFTESIDSYQVHRELSQRKKKSDESYQQYLYAMLDIGNQAEVDFRTIMQYTVEGIPDDPSNKMMLYGAKSVRQLKEAFRQYESMQREKSRIHDRENGGKKKQ